MNKRETQLERNLRISLAENKHYHSVMVEAIRVLTDELLCLDPDDDLPLEPSIGGQLAQCVESLAEKFREMIKNLDNQLNILTIRVAASEQALDIAQEKIRLAPHGSICSSPYPVCNTCGYKLTEDIYGSWYCNIFHCKLCFDGYPACDCWKSTTTTI